MWYLSMLDSYLSYLTLPYLILSIWPKSIGPVLDRMTLDVTGTSTTRTEWDRDGNHRKDRVGRCRAVFGKAIRVLPQFLHTASISNAATPHGTEAPLSDGQSLIEKLLGKALCLGGNFRRWPNGISLLLVWKFMEYLYIYLWHSNIV